MCLIFLTREITHNFSSNVKLVNSSSDNQMVNSEQCYCMGWGAITSFGSQLSSFLRDIRMSLLNQLICFNSNPRVFSPDIMLCCGDATKSVGTSFGDSGAPVICNVRDNPNVRYMIGIVSIGASNSFKSIVILSKISAFYEWINFYADNEQIQPPRNPFIPGEYFVRQRNPNN